MPRDDGFQIDPKKIECNQWRYTSESSRIQRFRFDYGNRVLQVQWRNGYPDPHRCNYPNEAPPGRPIEGRGRRVALARKGYIYGVYEDEDFDVYTYYRGLIQSASRGKYINRIDPELAYRPMRGNEWKDTHSLKNVSASGRKAHLAGKGPSSTTFYDEEDY